MVERGGRDRDDCDRPARLGAGVQGGFATPPQESEIEIFNLQPSAAMVFGAH